MAARRVVAGKAEAIFNTNKIAAATSAPSTKSFSDVFRNTNSIVNMTTSASQRKMQLQLAVIKHSHPYCYYLANAVDLAIYLTPLYIQYFELITTSGLALQYGWVDNYTNDQFLESIGFMGVLSWQSSIMMLCGFMVGPLRHRVASQLIKAMVKGGGREVGSVGATATATAASTAAAQTVVKPKHVPLKGGGTMKINNAEHKPSPSPWRKY